MDRRAFAFGAIGALGLLGGCASSSMAGPEPERTGRAPEIPFAAWTDDEPYYLFYPGDQLEVQVPSAPELNRQAIVGPDGRIALPLIGPLMAAYRSVPELQAVIAQAYGSVLRAPEVFVLPGTLAPMRVLVGGEVRNPGWIDLPGELDALQAVMAAGGFLNSAKRGQVVLVRRSREGFAMRRILDLEGPLNGRDDRLYTLRRHDIVYVPRTAAAEVAVFVEQYINNVIPGALSNYFAYQLFN